MSRVKQIINEELYIFLNEVDNANFPSFGDHLRSISEVGEANLEPYEYKPENISYSEMNYLFTTEDNDDYTVYIINTDKDKKVWEMEFGVSGYDYKAILDKGRMFRIMATVLKIVNDFIDKYKPNVLKFEPSKTKGEIDNRRFNIYMEYVKKNMRPDYFAYEYKPYIIIEKKIKK